MYNIIRYLYTLLFLLGLPVILLRLLWKSRKNPAYRARIRERFGYVPTIALKQSIWIHAVSVGEVLAAVPLIKKLQAHYPQRSLLITTMTPTGKDRVKAIFGETVFHLYLPYDVPFCVRRFLNKTGPRLAIFIETELWPNLLHACARQKIPVAVLNARLSAKSAAGYRRLRPLTKPMFKQITLVAAQNKEDGARFIELGLAPERLHITGSLKFDLEIPVSLIEEAQRLRAQWGMQRPVWIAASTHEGEEEIILETFKRLRLALPELVLILAPRHLERFQKVAALCRQYSGQVVLRSERAAITPALEILLGDTMGELLLLYACADVAFVGGSLVNTGGHNPLEPAALGLPVIVGPHTFNFAVITQQLMAAGALLTVERDALASAVLNLLQDKTQYQQMQKGGLQVMAENRGALLKQFNLIEPLLD